MRTTRLTSMLAALLVPFLASASAAPLLNEFHYDNVGTDEGEFLEVVLTGATNASDVNVTLYNGNGGAQYNAFNVGTSFTFHGTLADGHRYYSLLLPVNGLQNGSPDGIAVDLGGSVAEFWSYEGTFVAADGPAVGLMSQDVGAAEPSSTPIGSSLQRLGLGDSWLLTEGSSTRGQINIPEPATLALLAIGGLAIVRKRRSR